ncbi:MAG: alpha/beta hydrolase [Candidatus Hodarchaeota archaeon]
MEKEKRIKLCFLISVIVVFFSGAMAYGFQTHFGTIDVQEVAIVDEFNGDKVVGKLYRPLTATMLSPAPAVLGLHGYNNDKDVQRPAALELAKAGFVVLALDQTGHGDSEGISNFYLQGADAAYKWLAGLSFVDGNWMGIYGHSMGYIVGAQVAVANPDHDACAFQSFPPFIYNFSITHNILHIWSEYEEWYDLPYFYITGTLPTPFYTSDMTVAQVVAQGISVLETNAGIAPGTGAVDTNYGTFAIGTGYREHLVKGLTHPGETMDQSCTAEIVAWMLQALKGLTESAAWTMAAIPGQTYIYLEIFGGLALLFSFVSVVFLTQILLGTKYFGEVKQPMPERVVTKKKYQWWIFATANTVIAAVFYGLFTHADVHWDPAKTAWGEPFLLGMVNNWLGFFLTTAAAALFLMLIWYFMSKRKDRGSVTLYDLGATYDSEGLFTTIKNKAHWQTFGKTALLAILLFGWMYLLVSIFQIYFLIEFRIFWAFAKMFTPERFLMFLLYLPMFIPFFLLNGGVFLFGQIRQEESSSSIKTHLIWWAKIFYATLFGLLILFLIQYIGVAFGNYPYNGWWFQPIMPIQLMSAIPWYALLYLIMMIFYRRTGKIYLGSFFGAIMTTWFLTVGTVMAPGL